MKYALLGYDLDGTLDQLARDSKRALHRRHAALGEHAPINPSVKVVAHYRFRPSPLATVHHDANTGTPIRVDGAASETSATLRALYILDSDDPDAVIQLAEQLPATSQGATVEIWPLTEPRIAR
jgi:hypothetical protein